MSSRCAMISVLWLVWLGLLPGTFVAATVTGQGGWSRFWWVSSTVLAMGAWINALWHRRDRLGPACALVASGITMGMLADLYGAYSVIRFTEPLTMIVPLFALGHIGYIAGLLMLAGHMRLRRRAGWRGTLACTILLYNFAGLALWIALVRPSDALPGMHLPTAGYTVFLATAAAVMATVACLERRFLAVAIGGVVFLVSDGFLAVQLFQGNWAGLGDWCWITYGIGQMLIVYGVITGTWSWPPVQRGFERGT